MVEMTPAERVAAVKDIAVAILPPSASARERALLAAELARLSLFAPEVIGTIWDPMRCPAHLLSWLAWALSVDVWDPSWPEQTKRAVVAAAPGVHRLKGTRAAVQRALNALGMTIGIVEWWETEPLGRRGTASITAYATAHFGDDVVLSERMQRQAIATIRAAKPKSRVIDYRIGAGFRHTLGSANAASGLAVAHDDIQAGPDLARRSTLVMASAASGFMSINVLAVAEA